jgi:predicted aspartyl protease
MPSSFTVTATGLLRELITDAFVGSAFDLAGTTGQFHVGPPNITKFSALWDTGATGTVITQKVIDALGLKPIGMTMASGVDGEYMAEVYLVSVGLPNGIGFSKMRVTKGKLGHLDMLIGMDIITCGDFALTHHEGKTCFSFRCPPTEKIDFIKKSPTPNMPFHSGPKVGRNDKCPCGSGLKYKRCHGK